jgi:hypothetical protein
MSRIVFMVSLVVISAFSNIGEGWAQPKSGGQPPVIIHSYALDKGVYGQTWKIYIEAEDPDGDMLKIASVLEQEGIRYRRPIDFIFLKKRDRKQLKGFLSLNTYFLREPSMAVSPRLTLRVSISDKAGNESKEAVFHFEFVPNGAESAARLPAPFDQGDIPKLGNILIEGKDPPLPSS